MPRQVSVSLEKYRIQSQLELLSRDCGKTFKLTRYHHEKNKHVLAVKAENMKKHGSGCLGDSGNALVIKRRGQYVQLGHFLAPTGAQGVRASRKA